MLDGRFRIVGPIGKGGFGEVFRADELLPGGAAIRQVALKVLAPGTDPDAWAEEAKILASFSHPALVTVLAAGLLSINDGCPPAPFVAMELLDGETLGAVLAREGPLPWRRVLAWARDVAAALDVIHARDVVHLDLKPGNLFLTAGGAIKVLDFGIARRAGRAAATSLPAPDGEDDANLGTAEFLAERAPAASPSAPVDTKRPRSIVGTLGYMAPEVLEERPATPAADAYALAASIVHLATGRLPHDVPPPPDKAAGEAARRAFWDEVRHATSAGRMRDLEPDIPRGVAQLCRRLLALEPSARGVAPGGLRALLDAAWDRPFGVPDPPYLGLAAFGPAAEGMLFGRDDDIARLARDLSDQVVLLLQGVSGSGKSSLAMAGVIPALARRDAASGPDWRTIVVRPGSDPDAALDRALASVAPELAGATAEEAAIFARDRNLGLGLVFDQLEELVTQARAGDDRRRDRFVAFLAGASSLPADAPVRVVATLREDFTSTILGIEPLGDHLRDAIRFVGPPTMAAVRAIVAQPAELSGVRVTGTGDVAADVERELRAGDGRLPLVSLALSAWWRHREGDTLTADAWRALGGVRAIFANLADGVFADLDPAAQAEARAALPALSTDGRTRRSLPRQALRDRARAPEAFDRAVDAFLAAGLLIDAGGTLEVVHEFLFTAWDRLDGWLSDARAGRRMAAALREGARTWQELGRPVTRLPSDAEVALSRLVLAEGGLSGEDAVLQHEWLRAADRRALSLRVRAAGIAAVVLGMALVALGAWGKMVSDAQARVDQSRREADAAAARARENEEQAKQALREAREAQEEADRSRKDRKRAADLARLQQTELERLLHESETETQKARARCMILERRDPPEPRNTAAPNTTPGSRSQTRGPEGYAP